MRSTWRRQQERQGRTDSVARTHACARKGGQDAETWIARASEAASGSSWAMRSVGTGAAAAARVLPATLAPAAACTSDCRVHRRHDSDTPSTSVASLPRPVPPCLPPPSGRPGARRAPPSCASRASCRCARPPGRVMRQCSKPFAHTRARAHTHTHTHTHTRHVTCREERRRTRGVPAAHQDTVPARRSARTRRNVHTHTGSAGSSGRCSDCTKANTSCSCTYSTCAPEHRLGSKLRAQ